MEELETQTYCQRAALELVALLTHQRRPRGRQRRDSALLRRFVTEVLSSGGPSPERLQDGPWRVATRPLKKRGRGGLDFIPLVERGQTTVMVSTPKEAEELVAFLNYCGMDEFTTR
jgi:hypothetical protein